MSQEQNVYKELYETQQANRGFQNTLGAIISNLSVFVEYDVKAEGASLEGLLQAVADKCGYVAPVEEQEEEAK